MKTEHDIKNFLHEQGWQPTPHGNFTREVLFSRNEKGKKKLRKMRVMFRPDGCEVEMQSLFDTSWIRVGHCPVEKIIYTRRGVKIGDALLLEE